MGSVEAKNEIVQIAKEMLNGEIHLILGCRYIRGLRHDTEIPEDDIFMTFRAVDSETDHFPLGKVRELCDPEYLERRDKEITAYLEAAGDDIRKACIELIKKFSNELDDRMHK